MNQKDIMEKLTGEIAPVFWYSDKNLDIQVTDKMIKIIYNGKRINSFLGFEQKKKFLKILK